MKKMTQIAHEHGCFNTNWKKLCVAIKPMKYCQEVLETSKEKNSNDAAKNAGEVSLGRMGAQLKKMVCA